MAQLCALLSSKLWKTVPRLYVLKMEKYWLASRVLVLFFWLFQTNQHRKTNYSTKLSIYSYPISWEINDESVVDITALPTPTFRSL